MQLKHILILVAVLVLGGCVFLFMNKNNEPAPYEPVIIPSNEIPPETVMFYSASDEEARVTFTGVDATIEYAPIGTVTLSEIESGSGGLYTNDTETLTLWDRGDKITVWEGDTMLFEGYGEKTVEDIDTLVDTTWIWEGMEKSDGTRFSPKATNAFTITFEGTEVKGKTDCNGFFGAYTRNGDMLTFGALGSTKMYCDGSEEGIFTSALMDVDRYRIDESGKLSLFLKNEAGALHLRPE